MGKVVVADASCLIALSKIGHLSLLEALFGCVLLPPAVFHEVVVRGAGRPGAEEVRAATWIETREVKDRRAVRALKLTLGQGEAEAIVLAGEQSAAFLILDDERARRTALERGLPVVGTVALLKQGAQESLIDDLATALHRLREAGFYFSLE